MYKKHKYNVHLQEHCFDAVPDNENNPPPPKKKKKNKKKTNKVNVLTAR